MEVQSPASSDASLVCVQEVDGVSSLPRLRELYAAFNDIEDLAPLADLEQLEVGGDESTARTSSRMDEHQAPFTDRIGGQSEQTGKISSVLASPPCRVDRFNF
jgi:hypothetical protein